MRPLALIVALAGLGALVLAAPALRARVSPPAAEPPALAAQDEVPTVRAPVPLAVRPVAPEIVAPPPLALDVLERIEERAPLGPIGRAPAPSEGPPKETVLHRPLVIEAGAFAAMGHRIVLAGLVPTPADEICDSGGVAWPCGVHARTAFRNYLRGRALACVVPPAPTGEALTTPCRLGKADAGEWLAAQGWARPDPADDRYATQAKAAREAGRGLYGPAPSTTSE